MRKICEFEKKIHELIELNPPFILKRLSEPEIARALNLKQTNYGFINKDHIKFCLGKKYEKVDEKKMPPFLDGIITLILDIDKIVIYSYYFDKHKITKISYGASSMLAQELEEEFADGEEF